MMNSKALTGLFVLIFIMIWIVFSSGAIALESLLPKEIPEGWALLEGPRIYTKKTLFEHINGQAELFFKYGFQKSVFAIYQYKENHKNQIELDIYDMGSVLHAFGVFSRFRSEDQGMGIGLDSYLDEHSAIFYKGKYFVMFYSTESNLSTLKQFSISVSSKITDPSPPPREISYFPKFGLEPGSIQYFSEGLLGHQFLKRGFIGTYIDQVEFNLFLAIFRNSDEAINSLNAYRNYLVKKGKVHSDVSNRFGYTPLKGEDPYQGKVMVVHKEFYLLGVTGFTKEESSENLLTEFIKNITKGR
jgi:hypothetical protein